MGRLSPAFSLFEVLVVLVIVGLVSTISMTMLSQLRRNLDRFFPAAEHYTRLEIRITMLSSLIASLVPSRVPDMAFVGGQAQLTGLATYFPADPWPGEQRVRLAIASERGISLVTAERLNMRGGIGDTFEVVRLPCDMARFYYLDLDLRWLEQWVQQREFPYLPLAVRLACEGGDRPMQVIAAIEREGVSIMTDVNLLQMKR